MSQEPLRLLLLEGQPGWSEGLLSVLHDHGLRPRPCRHPEDAQQQLAAADAADAADVIVVDLAIGAQSSQHFTAWLHTHGLQQPVVAVGAQLDESSRVQLLESWADAVIAKPFAVPEFVARCRALWRRQQLRQAQERALDPRTHLRHGEVEMVVEEHQVWRSGEPVELTPREFRLLEYLLRHPGQILDRDTLLEQVWGEFCSLELDPKTVDVHVRWLRTKLELDPAAPALITTVRGRGYRLG